MILNSNGTPISTDPTAFTKGFDRNWIEQLNDPGSGQLSLAASDPWAAAITDDAIVECHLDDLFCFEWVIQRRKHVTIAEGEEEAELAVFTGKGRATVLERAVVYPEGGAGRPQTPDTRQFDYSSIDYDDSSWQFAQTIQIGTAPSGGPWPYRPDGLPDPLAHWVWAPGYVPATTPIGHAYFRKVVTLPTPGGTLPTKRYSIYATGDNAIRVVVDGLEVIGDHTDVMWAQTRQTYVDLDGGQHTIAVEGFNDGGPAGVIFTMYEVTNGGADLGAVVARTDASWKALGYPAEAPGMTPGRIMRILLAEAVARGTFVTTGPSLACVTTDFTDTYDSTGQPWGGTVSLSVPVGDDYLGVLAQLTEVAIDWQFTRNPTTGAPLLRLLGGEGPDSPTVFSKGGDRGPGLAPSGNILGLEHEITTEGMANVLLSRYRGAGVDQVGWREDKEQTSITALGRRERFLSAGPQDAGYVAKLAAALFVEQAKPKVSVTIAAQQRPDLAAASKARAYVDYRVGEWVWAPNVAGVSTRYRVRGVTVTEDELGNVSTTPELSTIAIEFEERLQRWLKRMAPGSLYGIVFNAAPVLPPVSFDQVMTIPVGLGDATDVYLDGATPGDLLGLDEYGDWVPIDPGGFGGSGIPQFSFPGQVGVQSSVKHRVIGGGGTATVTATLAVSGTTSTTFVLRVAGVAVGTFVVPANLLVYDFAWSRTWTDGEIMDVRVTVPGTGIRGLGVQVY